MPFRCLELLFLSFSVRAVRAVSAISALVIVRVAGMSASKSVDSAAEKPSETLVGSGM
jgi:hypothetical protein